ncbi:MAG: 2-oxoacid:acceptor oxidoreductase family protein [Sedimentisphaerales bacterium]|nr:2-oxoacid:acceptor oxidoreductase family protein [Sedimentisphaerales bacterium]
MIKPINDNEIKIIIAGFGGQGVVLAGNVIAKAAMLEDKNVTLMVSYGAEMRGGTANSTVVISHTEVASPYVEIPDIAVILNRPSLDRFEPVMATGGILVLNTSLVNRSVKRSDLKAAAIEATDIARQLGAIRSANMVALGALAEATGLLKPDSLIQTVRDMFEEKKPQFVEINIRALRAGMEAVHV